ncbi:MAG: M28 family peptidase [Eubacteriales bacterium]|nr:M28 family peptidase [Eubacteriales bacterium]
MDQWKKILDFGPRPVGSPAHDKTMEFIYQEMKGLGTDVHKEEFWFPGWENRGTSYLTLKSPEKRQLESWLFLGSGNGDAEGELRWIGTNYIWNMYGWDLYAIFSEEQEIVGYVSGRIGGDALSQTLIEGNGELPHFIVGEPENERLKELLQEHKVSVQGHAECGCREIKGTNIIVHMGVAESNRKKIMICAHYDSMYNTVGAYDNWAGTTVLMEFVKRYSGSGQEGELEIVFTDGEECRLAGSVYHAGKIDPGEYACVLNIDGIGRGNVMEIWGGAEWFNRKVLKLLSGNENTLDFHLKWPPPPGSDHKPFYDMGIPVCMLTVNDQGIIHTPKDIYDDSIEKNMNKILALVEYLVRNLQIE